MLVQVIVRFFRGYSYHHDLFLSTVSLVFNVRNSKLRITANVFNATFNLFVDVYFTVKRLSCVQSVISRSQQKLTDNSTTKVIIPSICSTVTSIPDEPDSIDRWRKSGSAAEISTKGGKNVSHSGHHICDLLFPCALTLRFKVSSTNRYVTQVQFTLMSDIT